MLTSVSSIYAGGGPGGWGCAIVEVPYQFYRMYGDLEPMKKYFGQMLHYLEYLENHSARDIVISTQPGLWCLGEWCTPEMLKYFRKAGKVTLGENAVPVEGLTYENFTITSSNPDVISYANGVFTAKSSGK